MEVVLSCSVCHSDRIQNVDREFNFCRCGACGYVFDSPRPTFAEIAAFYSHPARYDAWLAAERARDVLWRRRLRKLRRHSVPGNLLDIGAGTGQFLHHAQAFFSSVTGTEVSESAAQIAKEKYGIALHHGAAEEINLPPAAFANITLFHVLEHVPDPEQLIRRCHELMQSGGTVTIAVPNDVLAWTSAIKRLGKRAGLAPFQKFSPVLGISRAGTSQEIHLSHFTAPVLRQLIESAGLCVLHESIDPYYATSGLRRLLDRTYFGLHWLLQAGLRINRYDTLWMVARKP